MINELPTIQNSLSALVRKVDFIKTRFQKDSICIGVAGGARMGKSTLLQTLTSLDGQIIPSSNGTQTTGARSVIYHHTGAPFALVEFYSSDEILNGLIKDYYTALNALDIMPSYLDSFLESPIFPEEDHLNVSQKSKLVKLKEVQLALKKEQASISHNPQQLHVDVDQVNEFISQVDGRTKYIIVKNVKIYTKFNTDQDLTKLSIVDLPGLGEIALGHEKRLISALETEVDALLVVKKPSHDGSIWESDRDIGLFETIQNTLPTLNLKHWLFCVLNKTLNPSNQHVIDKLIEEKKLLPKDMSIYVCDVTDKTEVQDLFLNKVLTHIQENLKMIDQTYINEIQNGLNTLKSTILEKLTVQENIETDQGPLFDRKFNETWKEMKSTFTQSLNALDRRREDGTISQLFKMEIDFGADKGVKDMDFNQFLLLIREHMMNEHSVPTPENLIKLYQECGGEWEQVVLDIARILRTHLSRILSQKINYFLNFAFEQEFDFVFETALPKPVKSLITMANQGSSAVTWKEKFNILRSTYLADQTKYPIICESIDFLLQCNFDYYTLFHAITRRGLGKLDFSARDKESVEYFLPNQKALRKDSNEYAEYVHEAFKTTYQEILYSIVQKLSAQQFKPRDAIYFVLSEFRDRITELKYQKENQTTWFEVRDEWGDLLRKHKNIAWLEFNEHEEKTKILQDWLQFTNQLKQNINQLSIEA